MITGIDDPKRGVSQADVYQMMAYGELYRSSTLTLLYPHYSELEGEGGLLADHAVTGSAKRLRVATIDISKPSGISERLAMLVPLTTQLNGLGDELAYGRSMTDRMRTSPGSASGDCSSR